MAVHISGEQLLPNRQFQQRDALLNAPSRNTEEMFAVGLGEPAVPLRNVGCDRQCSTTQLVSEKEIVAWKSSRQRAGRIGERDRLLVNQELLKCEGHGRILTPR